MGTAKELLLEKEPESDAGILCEITSPHLIPALFAVMDTRRTEHLEMEICAVPSPVRCHAISSSTFPAKLGKS